MLYVCVDFDGTIVDHSFPEIGRPVPGAIKWLKRLNKYGARLILYTMRSDCEKYTTALTDALKYLESSGVTFYSVNENPSQGDWTTSPKVYAHVYIDDSAFGCPLIRPEGFRRPCVDWSKVGPHVEHLCLRRRGAGT